MNSDIVRELSRIADKLDELNGLLEDIKDKGVFVLNDEDNPLFISKED